MKNFTVGYGGRGKGTEFVDLLTSNAIKTVVDVRLRPDRASMGIFIKSKTPDKGIESLLNSAGLSYMSLVELGNMFVDLPDWEMRYERFFSKAGDLLTERLLKVPQPFCLLCAEKNPHKCHRKIIAEYLTKKGFVFEHLI